ncbi:hypothetical protein BB8028_0003g10050 [Beauveria bassiana]|uniref:Uncharacterized protein n=1 Tax=Beauveria bassiana TaxID=176275 RepID=A0A2S7Y8A3_BEABA|nr:hypothetical protein BB8028_0003g10050 [Beauveria bassiana]
MHFWHSALYLAMAITTAQGLPAVSAPPKDYNLLLRGRMAGHIYSSGAYELEEESANKDATLGTK